jgi:hypothetical protein
LGGKAPYLGGERYKRDIDGSTRPGKRTRGAYPDIAIPVSAGFLLIIEIDENMHRHYELLCELARYDAIQWGQGVLRDTVVIRFNPHKTSEHEEDLEERLQKLCQVIADEMTKEEKRVKGSDIDRHDLTVKYMFYNTVFLLF